MEFVQSRDIALNLQSRTQAAAMPIGLPADFRVYLQEELLQRCRKNRRYSLRSFASSLGIGSSELSKLIHRNRGLSEAMLLRLGKKIGLGPELIETYRRKLISDKAKSLQPLKTKGRIKGRNPVAVDSFQTLSLDAFHILSDWYPLAILELTKLRGFIPDKGIVARALGITVNEVSIACERLGRLGFLEIDKDGQWLDRAGSTTGVTLDYTNLAKRNYQKQVLEKAILAVDSVPLELRDQSSMLMAVNSEKLPEARRLISEFRRNLCQLMESGEEKSQVMFLCVSLFPIVDTKYLQKRTNLI